MQVGDLVRIKKEHINEEWLKDIAWDSHWTGNPFPPPEDQWLGLVMNYIIDDNGKLIKDIIAVQWLWSGRTVTEYTEHLEVVPKTDKF
tara:strand:+ start:172 stop:435 length:264 start_codon:yes stop_codon:yes gene_type:complete